MQREEPGLNPWPFSGEGPLDRGKEDSRLEGVLDDDSCPIVLEPVVLQRQSKGDADACREDEQRVTPCQGNRILGEAGGEVKAKGNAASFNALDIGLNGEDEDGDPEEGEKTPEFVGGGLVISDVKGGLSRGERD